MNAAPFHLLVVDRQRNEEEGDVIFGYREVMHTADVGHRDFGTPNFFPLLIDLEYRDDIAPESARFVAERDNVAGA